MLVLPMVSPLVLIFTASVRFILARSLALCCLLCAWPSVFCSRLLLACVPALACVLHIRLLGMFCLC